MDDTCIRFHIGVYTYKYDLNGNLIEKIKNTEPKSNKIIYFFEKEGIQILSNYEIDNLIYEIVLLQNGKILSKYFPHERDYTLHDQYMGSPKVIVNSGSKDEVFYKRPYDYGIYKITPDGLRLDIRFIFPDEHSLPIDFVSNGIYKNKKIEYIQQNRSAFYGINNLFRIGENQFFSVSCMDISKNNKRDFILNLKDGKVISIADIEPDALSSYLPITTLGLNPEFFFHGFHLYKEGYLYNSIPSVDMISLKLQSRRENTQYGALLDGFFKKQQKDDNPIIVILKPKGN